jgi:hypothetical protein
VMSHGGHSGESSVAGGLRGRGTDRRVLRDAYALLSGAARAGGRAPHGDARRRASPGSGSSDAERSAAVALGAGEVLDEVVDATEEVTRTVGILADPTWAMVFSSSPRVAGAIGARATAAPRPAAGGAAARGASTLRRRGARGLGHRRATSLPRRRQPCAAPGTHRRLAELGREGQQPAPRSRRGGRYLARSPSRVRQPSSRRPDSTTSCGSQDDRDRPREGLELRGVDPQLGGHREGRSDHRPSLPARRRRGAWTAGSGSRG